MTITNKIPQATFIDVDNTLLQNGIPNQKVLDWILENWGTTIYAWSHRGADHARTVCIQLKIEHVMDGILTKPTHIIDSKGWSWISQTERIIL